MEDYKKKYEAALSRASHIKDYNTVATPQEVAELLFPELKESEDERIRKEIIQSIQDNMCVIHKDKCIAWLEKQGEQKPFDYENANIQQKDFASKVEPKFKVGDWVIYNRNDSSREIIQVYDIRDGRYYFTDNVHFSWSIKECDEKAHLWTIQDAKDGDVLATDNGGICIFDGTVEDGKYPFAYCGVTERGFEFYDGKLPFTHANVQPATKEQRDLLFQKMKEAGYEWDDEKKKLRKIEQKPISDNTLKEAFDKSRKDYSLEEKKEASDYSESIIPTSIAYGESEEEYMLHKIIEAAFIAGQNTKQKPTWSKEDEQMFKLCASSVKTRYNDGLLTYNEYEQASLWLESLKERYTWKPSDEQMKALWDSIPENVKEISEREMLLDSLYQDLKKLRKE